MECRKQKQREWVIRLSEEVRNEKGYIFVTLTINDECYKLLQKNESENGNDVCTRSIRMFLERIRKETGKSVKHWFITELGGDNGRIHMHGLMKCNADIVKRLWGYGYVFIGSFVNEKTVMYITKYMLKQNKQDRNFIGKVLCSKGIGSGYFRRGDAKNNAFNPNGKTSEVYRLRNGARIALPEYFRRKLYSDEERDKLWIEKQEKGYRYIMGEKVFVDDENTYNNLLEYYQQMGRDLYGDDPKEWDAARQRERLRKMKLYRERMKNK